jgi:hypothetical protein
MDIVEKLINKDIIPKLRYIGFFPLILSYLINCDIDYFSILCALEHFSSMNTLTIVNLIEKVNFDFPFTNYLQNCSINNKEKFIKSTDNLVSILPMLNFDYLKIFKKFLSTEKIFKVIKNYPLIFRKKEILRSILDTCCEIIETTGNDSIIDSDFSQLLSIIFSLILYKKNTKCSFLYSTCLNKSLMKDLCNVREIY